MNILIIGGTVFVGRHLVEAALARGHSVTLFNRGQHNPDLFPDVERIRGDRDGGLDALAGRQWDAVIDTCGYVPRIVAQSAQQLAKQTGHYTFISTISVYRDGGTVGLDESGAVGTLDDPTTEEVTGTSYGPLKAICETIVEQAFPEHALIIRPGLIVGPHDPTDRFTYWPHRLAQGGNVVAPLPRTQPVQIIDVRDLAEWTIKLVEQHATGVYHASGPAQPYRLEEIIAAAQTATASTAQIEWVSEACLLGAEVVPWTGLPLWLPAEAAADELGIMQLNPSKALAAGLHLRPLAATMADTAAWDQTRGDYVPRAGLTAEQETAILHAWHTTQTAA